MGHLFASEANVGPGSGPPERELALNPAVQAKAAGVRIGTQAHSEVEGTRSGTAHGAGALGTVLMATGEGTEARR
eukprot:7629299-Alexandrium_andersonii.AAC.1